MPFVQDHLHSLMGALSAHPYLALFIGMIVAGEVVLLPAIYLAATGRMDLLAVLTVSLLATLISDCLWYALGRRFPVSTLKRMSGRASYRFLGGLEQAFNAGGKRLLFLSKFVYGTRTLVQVLAGIHQMPFRSYLIVNTAGVVTMTTIITALAYSVIGTTHRLNDVIQHMEIAFLVFVLLTVTGFVLVSKKLRQQWSL